MRIENGLKIGLWFTIFLTTSLKIFGNEYPSRILHVQSIENRLMETKGINGRVHPYLVSVESGDSLNEIFAGHTVGNKIDFESPKGSDGYLRVVGTIKTENDSMSSIKLYVEFRSSQFRFKGKFKNGDLIAPYSATNAGKIFYPKGVVVYVSMPENELGLKSDKLKK